MDALVGGSGHMAGYALLKDSFQIDQTEEIEKGLTKYSFSANAYYESEFSVYTEDQQIVPDPIQGSIILDEDFNLTRDKEGRVRLEPWKCLDPDKKYEY